MFALYVIIDHNKLLKKSTSIDEERLQNSLVYIIEKTGGLISEFSPYMAVFPSKYEDSLINFACCLQDINRMLLNNRDLVGFSIVIDSKVPDSDFEVEQMITRLHLQTSEPDSTWFTPDVYKKISHLINCERKKNLYLADSSFIDHSFTKKRSNDFVNQEYIDFFSLKRDQLSLFKNRMNINLFRNIDYWAELERLDKVFYIDLDSSPDVLLTIIDYLTTLRDLFNPNFHLDSEEVIKWGHYLELFNKFCLRNYDSFILDDAVIHFNKLILLWIKSFTRRYSLLLILKGRYSREIEEICTILSLIDNITIFYFDQSLSDNSSAFLIPEPDSDEDFISAYLEKQNDETLTVLYSAVILKGTFVTSDILSVFKNMGINPLSAREELNRFISDGVIIGYERLYPCQENLPQLINNLRPDVINAWREKLLEAIFDLKFHNVFSYSYIVSLMGLKTSFKYQAYDVLYSFIQKLLDLGRFGTFSKDFLDESHNDAVLKNIIIYKEIRENRLKGIILDRKLNSLSQEYDKFETAVEFMDILNSWSLNNDGNLLNRCKSIYYRYQAESELYNESRAKIIFSLALLGLGRVGEAVDYFELNCGSSKNISDTYSYIRNGCFLSISLFIKGDISGVLRVTSQFLDYGWIYFKSRWLLYLNFIRARALNELGDYENALILLDWGIVLAKNNNYRDILTLLNNWKAKTLYFLEREGEAREILLTNQDSIEGTLFLAEIEYYSGDIKKGLSLIQSIGDFEDDRILFDENLKWRDGYFIIEEFFNRERGRSVLKDEVINLRYLLEILNGNREALIKYKKIILDIPNNSIELYDYKYIYYLYLGMEFLGDEEEINRENLYNRIIRLIHNRASQLGEHNQKHLYFENFLNSQIMGESKRKKFFN